MTGPKVCIGGFAGKEGNSVLEGVRFVLLTEGAGDAYEVDTGAVTMVWAGWTGRLPTAGDTQGELAAVVVTRLVDGSAGPANGDAAVPQDPCRALRAEGVVEDLIFSTRAPPADGGEAPLPANGE